MTLKPPRILIVVLLATLSLLLGAAPAAADHETEGDTDTRLEYVTEWLGGELVDCYAAMAPASGLHCSKHDGEWTAELKALMVDGLNTAKNRKRITALVVELLIAECEDNNDDDSYAGQRACSRSVVTETVVLDCAEMVVAAIGGGTVAERTGRLHDLLFTPGESGRPSLCGQPRVRATQPVAPPTAPIDDLPGESIPDVPSTVPIDDLPGESIPDATPAVPIDYLPGESIPDAGDADGNGVDDAVEERADAGDDDAISRAYREQQGFYNCREDADGFIECD